MNIHELIRQAQTLQKKLLDMQEEINKKTVEASAGGGMVRVVVNGTPEILKIELDPTIVDPNDITMLQDLIVAATNEALRRAKEMKEEEIAKLTGGIKLPNMGII